jgi:thioredoxin 1
MPAHFTRNILRTTVLLATALASVSGFGDSRQIYSDTADAHAEIRGALMTAAREHKRVILDFGGNWCGDCQVLDLYLHDPVNAGLLNQNYILVHVNIGRYDRNTDLADEYQVPLKKGVPGLAVLDSRGRVIYSQKNGEFEAIRKMESTSVTEFLRKWKPRS